MSLISNGLNNFVMVMIFFLYLAESSENALNIDDFKSEVHEIRGYTLQIYKGIRYSESCSHKNRFKDISPAKDSHVQHNTSNCPQKISSNLHKDIWKLHGPILEDCLYLNIWQLEKKETPVIVWIHGGDFSQGSTTIEAYDGKTLAARLGAVVVSIQYRLGALGFLSTGDEFAPGNAGLKDQVRALEWIHKHIHHFGGDNQKITVIGQSSGSTSLGYHLLSKKTSKLFQRAILMSGTPNSQVSFVLPGVAKDRAFTLASKLGAKSSDYDEVKSILSERRWEDIVKAQDQILDNEVHLGRPFLPSIDASLVTEHPINLMKKADHLRGKEIIISWTKDEGSLLLASQLKHDIHSNKNPPKINLAQFTEYISTLAKHDQNLTEAMIKLYYNGDDNLLQSLVDVVGDYYFKCPANEFADDLEKHGAKVYRMEYSYRLSYHPNWLGVAQGNDIEALFWHIQDYGVQRNYNKYLTEFVHIGAKGLEDKGWKKSDLFVIGSENPGDRRKKFCKKLNEIVPGYNSRGSPLLRNAAAMLLMMCHLIFII